VLWLLLFLLQACFSASHAYDKRDMFNVEMFNKNMMTKLTVVDEYYSRFNNTPSYICYLLNRVDISSRIYLADAQLMLCKELAIHNDIQNKHLAVEKERLELEKKRLYYEKKRLSLEMKQAGMFDKK